MAGSRNALGEVVDAQGKVGGSEVHADVLLGGDLQGDRAFGGVLRVITAPSVTV
jgi:hypothetical protein